MSGSIFQSGNTASLTLAGNNSAINNVSAGTYPPEGSRALTVQYNWSAQAAYSEDLQAAVSRGIESTIQGVFIDNSQCPWPVTLYIPGTMHAVEVPAYSQASAPVYFGTGLVYQISIPPLAVISGAATVSGWVVPQLYTRLIFLNVPTQPAVAYIGFPANGGDVLSVVTANQTIKTGAGRLASVFFQTVTAVGTIQLYDREAGGALTAANTLAIFQIGVAAGTFLALNMPFYRGLFVNYNGGATGTLSIFYS